MTSYSNVATWEIRASEFLTLQIFLDEKKYIGVVFTQLHQFLLKLGYNGQQIEKIVWFLIGFFSK